MQVYKIYIVTNIQDIHCCKYTRYTLMRIYKIYIDANIQDIH